MADFSVKTLRDAMRHLQQTKPFVPTHLVVTEQGIDYQARRIADGEITLEQLQDAGVPEDIIGETARRAAILLGFLPK